MVQFNKDNFQITIPTHFNPIEDWLTLHQQLVNLLRCADAQLINNEDCYLVIDFLNEMMPDFETAKKMTRG